MIELRPMSSRAFEAYLQMSIEEYAQEMVSARNVSQEDAQEASEKQFSELLPDGLDSTGQHLLSIWDPGSAKDVGVLWVGERERGEMLQAVIYDIRVMEDLRGQGYGTQTLQAVEDMVRQMGISEIWLHVFGHNTGARRLYERLGYEITNVSMCKTLER
jgi:ribosomal protein S18 acetylase RimI-like enzyme